MLAVGVPLACFSMHCDVGAGKPASPKETPKQRAQREKAERLARREAKGTKVVLGGPHAASALCCVLACAGAGPSCRLARSSLLSCLCGLGRGLRWRKLILAHFGSGSEWARRRLAMRAPTRLPPPAPTRLQRLLPTSCGADTRAWHARAGQIGERRGHRGGWWRRQGGWVGGGGWRQAKGRQAQGRQQSRRIARRAACCCGGRRRRSGGGPGARAGSRCRAASGSVAAPALGRPCLPLPALPPPTCWHLSCAHGGGPRPRTRSCRALMPLRHERLDQAYRSHCPGPSCPGPDGRPGADGRCASG
jgi:hypothetical protein